MLLAAEAGRSFLIFPLGEGVWTLDGVPLAISSATQVPVIAGTHRVEFRPALGPMVSLFEDLHVDHREVVTWIPSASRRSSRPSSPSPRGGAASPRATRTRSRGRPA
jgi:hypothetical protein